MRDEELAGLYRRTLEGTMDRPDAECPALERLQAVAEGEADADERMAVMNHVASCLRCQGEVALLAQVATARPRSGRGIPVAWLAAAATVVLAFAGLRVLGSRETVPPVLRGDGSAVMTVSPAGNVAVAAAGALVWRSVAGATRFEVEILTPEGELVYSDTVRDTVAPMPPGIAPSRSYRWRVTAVQADGARTESALVTFTITPD
jgi:hypothetical protein